MSASTEKPTPWGSVAALVVALAALVGVLLTAFAWPAVGQEPHGVPVAVAGPAEAADSFTRSLAERAGEEAFEVTEVPDRAAAEELVADREVYGAFVMGPDGAEVLVASAASPAVARLLTGIGAAAPAEAGGPWPVTDLVPAPEDDPQGVGVASLVLPLVIGGMAGAVVISLRVRGTARRLVGVLALAALGGLVMAGVLQGLLGALEGRYWLNAGVLALGTAAIGTVLLGLRNVFGVPGLAVGAAVTMLLGNPLSGVTSAPELLPAGWGALGQWLQPGATGSALRSVAWFDGAGAGPALLTLGLWLLVGLVLSAVPGRDRARAVRSDPGADAPVAVGR
ncbi:hypothetical protein DFP74_5965 [Nocardiopsis sp. Huas11]|uniref:hypothetical protein n=1 Tax=Nocardiopsis sp. Huas11 TaxID=2183912 RepID=UPI000F28B888|nr:hypothetical protein [Nocardiopsis sp. Huas11]RKS10208.1 hypothetical protein DFP74_5965 [Nocardiopsis sp. Huas11]